MADNQVNVDYTLGADQAQRELDKLQAKLRGITADFNQNAKTITTNINRLHQDLAETIAVAETRGRASLQSALRRRDQLEASTLNRMGRSSYANERVGQSNVINQAAAQGFINDAVNSTQAAVARVTDAIVRTTLQQLRTSEAAVEARIKNAQFSNRQGIANSDDRYLAARSTLADQRRTDTIYGAENGRAALASRNRFEQLNHNGGSDLMAIQGRVMANYMAVGALFNTMKSAIAGVVELDKELHQFQAISTATNREMVGFKKNLLDISATVPFTTLEMTKAATMLAQAGLSTSEVVASLGAVTKFATASGSDLSQSVDIVTSAVTAFNLETSRTGDVANTFTAALNLSKLSVDKLITAFNYIGPTANDIGLTLEETTSILGALSQSGVRASTMGTGFRALLMDLQSPSKKLVEALKNVGLSVDDVDVKTKGFLPVIEKLKASGFGAAEAYQSLELRAAASYIALSNNTDMAHELQRSFLLSAAATEANDIQMQSFANTAKNFGSVMTAAAFTGLEPVLGMMQKVLAATTSVFAMLNEIPGALQLIGIGAAAVGTVLAGSLGFSLLRSLTTMIPALGGIRVGLTAVTGALATATTVGGGFAAVLGLISKITMGGWVGLIVSGAVAAATAFYSWSDNAKSLANDIDDLKGRTNELAGAADASSKKISSIEHAIQGVVDRKAELETNELMRGAKIEELRHQFAELGLSIKDDTMSVTDLIRELHNLKQTSTQIRTAELENVQSSRALQIQALQRQQAELLAKPNEDFDRALLQRKGTGAAIFNTSLKQDARDRLINQMIESLGPDMAPFVRLANRDMRDFNDENGVARARGADNLISTRINELKLNPTATSERDVAFLEALRETLKPFVENITNLADQRQQQKLGDMDLAKSRVQGSNAYNDLETAIGEIEAGFVDQLREINKSGKLLPDKRQAYLDLQAETKRKSEEALAAFADAYGENNATVDALKDDAKARLAAISNGGNARVNEATKQLAKDEEKAFKAEGIKASKARTRLRKQLQDAANEEELKEAFKEYKDFLTEQREAISSFYERMLSYSSDPDAVEKLRDRRSDALGENSSQLDDLNIDNAAREQDLLKESLKRQKQATEDNAKALRSKIDLAIDELKRTPPSAAMDELVKKIRDLINQLSGETNKIANIDTQMSALDLNTPISEAIAGSAQSAVSHYINRGLSKNGAAAIASNLAVESNFNPKARGDYDRGLKEYTAFGVAQWRHGRWDEMKRFAGEKKTSEFDLTTQYDFVLKELARDYPQLFERLKSGAEDPQTLSQAFMKEYERPKDDPSINHVGKRRSYAQAFAKGTDTASEQAVEKESADLQKAIDANTAKSIKQASDATIKNMNARLGTLRTQARLNGDATSLADVQKQVQDAHAAIMKAELAKFDSQNSQLAKDDNPEFKRQREELQEKLNTSLNNDLLKVMEQFYKAADEELNKPVNAAKARLDAAKQPDTLNKFTSADIQNMEMDVMNREREAAANRILLIEQQIAEVRRRAAEAERQYGPDSFEANMWRNQENELIARNNELKATNNALDVAKASQGPSVAGAIQSATNAWAQSNGILDAQNKLIPLAKQVESSWGQVLTGLSNGFSSFFSNIASGTMSAKDAFKQLGVSILDMFTQIIAKALANQIIMSIFGGGAGGGIMGQLWQGLSGVVGLANGGIPRAANGAIPRAANGASPFRDNVLVNVMPGEGILRKSAMDMIGEGGFHELNNLGNRQISEGALNGRTGKDLSDQQNGGVVNVWVVSEDQVPPSGPNDIIATVAANIQQRGTIKQLIQQVQMGAV